MRHFLVLQFICTVVLGFQQMIWCAVMVYEDLWWWFWWFLCFKVMMCCSFIRISFLMMICIPKMFVVNQIHILLFRNLFPRLLFNGFWTSGVFNNISLYTIIAGIGSPMFTATTTPVIKWIEKSSKVYKSFGNLENAGQWLEY